MNDKEYVKKICSKCANRYNEKDLLNYLWDAEFKEMMLTYLQI